jgi:hypothetical protein
MQTHMGCHPRAPGATVSSSHQPPHWRALKKPCPPPPDAGERPPELCECDVAETLVEPRAVWAFQVLNLPAQVACPLVKHSL